MLDVKKLERRWIKYKLRIYFPWIGGFFVLSTALATSLFFLNSTSVSSENNKVVPKSAENIIQKVPTETIASAVEENTTWIEPSMSFVDSLSAEPVSNEISSNPANAKIYNKVVSPNTKASTQYAAPNFQEVKPTPNQPVTKSIKSEPPMAINRNESKLEIEALERRFKDNSNSNLGVFIAKYYYDHGNYNESLNYALKTNEINNNLEDSWLIFAKSLAKLGKTDQAKKTLKIYLDQSNSENAKTLLNSLEQGSFK